MSPPRRSRRLALKSKSTCEEVKENSENVEDNKNSKKSGISEVGLQETEVGFSGVSGSVQENVRSVTADGSCSKEMDVSCDKFVTGVPLLGSRNSDFVLNTFPCLNDDLNAFPRLGIDLNTSPCLVDDLNISPRLGVDLNIACNESDQRLSNDEVEHTKEEEVEEEEVEEEEEEEEEEEGLMDSVDLNEDEIAAAEFLPKMKDYFQLPEPKESARWMAFQERVRERGLLERARQTVLASAKRTAYYKAEDRKRRKRVFEVSAHEFVQTKVKREARPSQSSPVADSESEDESTPFSIAMKIVKGRTVINWAVAKNKNIECSKSLVPRLQDLCLNVLVENAGSLTSMEYVPDEYRHKISQLLCDSRRMNFQFLELLVSGSPTEIRVKDCSWLTEEQLYKALVKCDTTKLTVLQLDICGRCMHDRILSGTLAKSPNCLPALSAISLRGASHFLHAGFKSLVASAPGLNSINLGHCSLLTTTDILILADNLGKVLKELYIDDCHNIDVMSILKVLNNLQHLEVLSVAGIPSVCNDFVCRLVAARGPNLKELYLADCERLTDVSVKAIAASCSELRVLDLVNLTKLTDSSVRYLSNGCRFLQKFRLRCNIFSDEAIAGFIEASGSFLTELSLNYVKKVGLKTAISLVERCSTNMESLDLSWCREINTEAACFIVNSCLSLRMLKLFGCSQIEKAFIKAHFNPHLKIIGLNLDSIL